MKSWDCFDTLVARKYVDPLTVFQEIEKKYQIKGFSKNRRKAEKIEKGPLEKIYKHLPGIDPLIEFETELDQCFGILENLNKVADGDIIISDMYLSEKQVLEILKKCGLKKKVKVIVTVDGKKKRWIWNQIKEKIDLHTGDNYDSDVVSPGEYGIPAQHYPGHAFTEIENHISTINFDLACFSRFLRLQCPYEDNHSKMLWIDQCNINIPILILSSLELPKDKKIAFSYRDCAHWHQIYSAITGEPGIRLDISRICSNNPTSCFKKYVSETTKDSLIVDLTGTGESAKKFYSNDVDILYIAGPVVAPYRYLTNRLDRSIERFNVTNIDPLIGWDNGPIRGTCEHDKRATFVQEAAILKTVENIKMFNINPTPSLLQFLVEKTTDSYTRNNVKYQKG